MTFDMNNAAHLTALRTEVTADPLNMGYAAVVDQTAKLLDLLNDPDSNVGGETVGLKLTPRILLDAMVVDDFAGNTVTDGERRFIEVFLNRSNLDEDIDAWSGKIKAAFKTNSITVANLNALSRPLSRAEVLFGAGATIRRNDWFAARGL